MFPKTAREPQGRCCGWNGTPVFSPKGWLAPSSDAELCHAIDSVHGWGFRLRAVGSGRACSAGGGTSGYVMDTSGLQQPLEVDQRALTITVEAGMTLGHLCDLARENGMALASFGGQRARTVGGALALGSGSGPSLRHMPLHDCAVELVIVSPSGQRITVHEPASGANRVPIGRDGSRPTASLAAAIPGYGYDLSASPVSGGGGRGGGHGGGAGGGHGGAASVPGATTVLSASMASGSSPNSVSSFASSFASHSTATSGAESKTSGSSALPPLKPIAQSSFDDSGTHVAWIHHNTGNNNNNNNNNSDDDPERAERHRQQYVAQQQQQQQQQQYQHHHHHQQPQSLLPSSAGLSSDSNSTTLGGMTVEPAIPPPPDAFEERDHAAAILSLGRLGVIYSVTLRCVPRYSVAFRTESQPLSVTLHALAATAVRHEFVRFAWWPHTQIATVTTGHAVSPDKGAPGGKGYAFFLFLFLFCVCACVGLVFVLMWRVAWFEIFFSRGPLPNR
jgi:FAD/FMN-containing dehydrogenase